MPKKQPTNPFYVLLVIAGAIFALTATAYGVMTFRFQNPTPTSVASDHGHPLWTFLNTYGAELMIAELGLLGFFTIAAIATDEYWTRDAMARVEEEESPDPIHQVSSEREDQTPGEIR